MAGRSILGALLLSFIGAMVAACTAGDHSAQTPEGAVRNFYDWHIRARVASLPSQEQLAQMRPYVSNELYQLLSRTQSGVRSTGPALRERSFIDGDPFSSLADGPTSFIAADAHDDQSDVHVVEVRFMAAQQLPAVHWIDRVRVIREHDRYVVADVEYANHWRVGSKGQTLVGTLRKIAKGRRV